MRMRMRRARTRERHPIPERWNASVAARTLRVARHCAQLRRALPLRAVGGGFYSASSSPFLDDRIRKIARQEIAAVIDSPIPPHLWPQPGPLAEGDLCLVLSHRELAGIKASLSALEVNDAQLRIVQREGSPWIEIAVATVPHEISAQVTPADSERLAQAVDEIRLFRLALWRYTGSVYRVGDDGAVEDDPVWTFPQETS